jgi:hypothetical protein
MVAYTGIQGQNILIVSSDPANPTEGQIWYNSTSNLLKGYANVVVTAAWASGGNLNTARYGMGNAGIQTANIAFGGAAPTTTAVENYNGTSWTSGTSMPATRQYQGSSGTQTAALSSGGYNGTSYNNNTSQEWNGSSWSSGGNLNTGRGGLMVGIIGLQTAGLAVGGQSPGFTAASESYNGTAWTNTPSLSSPRGFGSGWGSNTAAIVVNGAAGGYSTDVESFNGSAWTTSTSYPTSVAAGGGFGNSYTNGINMDGESVPGAKIATCSAWNGTSWTATASLGTARANVGASGNTSNGLCIGGTTGSTVANTEEFTGASTTLQTRTITTS